MHIEKPRRRKNDENDFRNYINTYAVNTIGFPDYKHESKKDLIEYNRKLEKTICQLKNHYLDLEKDHEILTDAYIQELNINGKIDQAISIIKRLLNSLVGVSAVEALEDSFAEAMVQPRLCNECCEL